jgi:hypothetical protein
LGVKNRESEDITQRFNSATEILKEKLFSPSTDSNKNDYYFDDKKKTHSFIDVHSTGLLQNTAYMFLITNPPININIQDPNKRYVLEKYAFLPISNLISDFTPVPKTMKTDKLLENSSGQSFFTALQPDNTGGTRISIPFVETAEYDVTNTFRVIYEYMHSVLSGEGKYFPHRKYIEGNVIDFKMSLYCFMLTGDGYSVKSIVKLHGLTLVKQPFDAFVTSKTSEDHRKIDVDFLVDGMEIRTVAEERLNPVFMNEINKICGTLESPNAEKALFWENESSDNNGIINSVLNTISPSQVKMGGKLLNDYLASLDETMHNKFKSKVNTNVNNTTKIK